MQTGMTIEPSAIGTARRPRRLSLVLTLTFALLVSLAHCAICDLSFAANDTTVVTSLDDTSSAPAPDKELPACGGHCLNHVTTLSIAAVLIPADIVQDAPPLGRDRSPISMAGLPLFEPPRA